MSNKHYSAFEITEKGLALRQMAIANGLKVDFTRGVLGEGRPSDNVELHYMTALISHATDVPIKESYSREKNHIMTIVIDGTALQNDVMMTEMGIYARLIDAETNQEIMPEILYGYTFTSKYDYVPAGEEYNLYREISFDTVLSRNGKFEIVYDKTKVYVTRRELEEYGAQYSGYDNSRTRLAASNVQNAIDELAALHASQIKSMQNTIDELRSKLNQILSGTGSTSPGGTPDKPTTVLDGVLDGGYFGEEYTGEPVDGGGFDEEDRHITYDGGEFSVDYREPSEAGEPEVVVKIIDGGTF